MSTITQFPSGNTQYRIEFDYLARTFIVVTLVNSSNPTLNRVLEVGRDYRFLNPTMIEVLVDQSGFDIVSIHRQTGTDLVVDFRNGSVLTASDLTNAELQAIHIAEEGRDQTVDLAKGYADAAGISAGNAKDSEDEARRIAASTKAGLLGYITRRSFEKGFNVTTWSEVLLWEQDGEYYRWDGGLPKTVPVGSTPDTAGGVGAGKWLSVGDATLRGQLAAPTGFNLLGGRKKFVILATGQSNVQQEPAYAWEPPPNVFVWEWPGLNTNGVRFIPCPSTKINHTYAAAAELARLNPAWQVYVIRIASGGRPIEHWLPGGSAATLPAWNAYADCKNNTERALAILGVDKIDYFHWHQGENNIDDGSLYIAKWNNMFNRFVGETWFDTNTTVLVNGVTSQAIKGDPRYKTQNLMLKQIVTSRPWHRVLIPTSEIVPPEMWLSDGLHMTAKGHELLGRTEADMLNRGIATQVTRGYIYSDEDGTVCIGGANPAAGGVLEVNRGSNLDGTSKNARTSLDVINTQTGSSDIASSRVIGANGVYSVTTYGSGALTNTARIEWTGSSQIQMAVTAGGAFTQYVGTTEILRCGAGVLRPGSTDNTMALGTASNRFSQIYAAIGSINTSDGREKTKPLAIDDKVLDAWSEVPIITFQWLEAIRLKGEDSARWHFGVIAQDVRDAFLKYGIDGTQYGLLCYDEWDARDAVYRHLTDEELASGRFPSPQTMVLVEPAVEAGNRWGIRPDQCLFLESALQRRNYSRLLNRLEVLELKNH